MTPPKALELFGIMAWIMFKPLAIFFGMLLLARWISKNRVVVWNIDALSRKFSEARSDWVLPVSYLTVLIIAGIAWKVSVQGMTFTGSVRHARNLFYDGMFLFGFVLAYFRSPKVSAQQYFERFLGFTALAVPRGIIALWLSLSLLMLTLILDLEFQKHHPELASAADFLADAPLYVVWYWVLWVGFGKTRIQAHLL